MGLGKLARSAGKVGMLLALTGCTHNLATCDSARVTAQIAIAAMARICPMEAGTGNYRSLR
ncbi:hypothetical protein SAMN05518866_16014 [Sphingobium sp. YR768]|nr:hypothetical protein SAMN05518866_16014 [Sphingobium sp. YR768]